MTPPDVGENVEAASVTVAVPNNAAAASVFEVDLPQQKHLDGEARYAIVAYLPAAGVTTNVTLFNRETIGGALRDVQIDTFSMTAGSTVQRIVQGLFLGDGAAKVRVSPTVLVGAAGAYSVNVEARRL